MANYIEYAQNLTPEIYVTNTSRYINSSVIFYGNDKKITFTTFKRNLIPESSEDKFILITAGLEYRPDLVSEKAYGIPDYWWRIMQANSIYDVYQFKRGMTVRIPSNIT